MYLKKRNQPLLEHVEVFVALLAIVTMVGFVFKKFSIPIPLLLVLVGMALSYLPIFPHVQLDQNLILDVFLPLLIYEVSTGASWRDVKKNFQPIALLSVGHVFFITGLVAIVIHAFLPQLGWPVAILLGAVVSPPDDVAIVAIAEKIHMPSKIVTILKSEGMLNDAAALILFRFALAATLTHQFLILDACKDFVLIIVGETLYGIGLAFCIGKLRLRIQDPMLQTTISLLTPFLAYLPPERLGGCGVLSTAVSGLVIGHYFLPQFPVAVRLSLLYVWPTLGFILQSILFLLVGLDLRNILQRISTISAYSLCLYSMVVILAVIVGRFLWVYLTLYWPKKFFSARKIPWQYPIVISWAGMRGGISLAAALAVPSLPLTINGANLRDFIIFLVFGVILATLLIQGFTLPWVLKVLNIPAFYGKKERAKEHNLELYARSQMTKAVLQWLKEYEQICGKTPSILEEIKLYSKQYRMLKRQLAAEINKYKDDSMHEVAAFKSSALLEQIIDIERQELTRLWHEEKISYEVKKKLLLQLDFRSRHLE